jgi:hypothetical protein
MILMSANRVLCVYARDKIYNLIAAVEYPHENVILKFLTNDRGGGKFAFNLRTKLFGIC